MNIANRIEEVKNRVEKAASRAGRKAEDIALMGVSKFHGKDAVEQAIQADVFLFGENRVQEAGEKFPALREKYASCGEFELHMIGSLQRNKAKAALGLFDCIQSVDRDELIISLGNLVSTPENGLPEKRLRVLLEMHTGEESKSGYPGLDPLLRAAEKVLSFPGLCLSGLMTMAPWTKEEAPLRKSFRTLAAAREALFSRFPSAGLSCLSMGMSNDFEIAIEEGSTLLRIGTAIFGDRP